MDKKSMEFIQPGWFPGDFGNTPSFNTDGIEDGAMFTGVKEGPYGDGSRLTEESRNPDKILKRRRKVVVDPDGTIHPVEPVSEVEKMRERKAKIDYILSRLAAKEKEPKESSRPMLAKLFGFEESYSPDEVKRALEEVIARIPKLAPDVKTLDGLVDKLEEIEVAYKQMEPEASLMNSLQEEANKQQNVAQALAASYADAAAYIANDPYRENADRLRDVVERISIFHLLSDDLKSTITGFNPDDPENIYGLRMGFGIRAPLDVEVNPATGEPVKPMSEKTLGQLAEAIPAALEHAKEVYDFYSEKKHTVSETKEVVDRVIEVMRQGASLLPKAVERVYATLTKYSDAAKTKLGLLESACNRFMDAVGDQLEVPGMQKSYSEVEKIKEELAEIKPQLSEEQKHENRVALIRRMAEANARLREHINSVKEIQEGVKSLEAVPPAAGTEAVEPLPDVEQALRPSRIAAASMDSILAELDDADSEAVWGAFISELDAATKELVSVLEPLEEAHQELSSASAEVGAEDLELAGVANLNKILVQAEAVNFAFDPQEYLKRYTEFKAKYKGDKEALVQDYESAVEELNDIMAAYRPTEYYLQMFKIAMGQLEEEISTAKVSRPRPGVKGLLDKAAKAIRNFLGSNQESITQDPDFSSVKNRLQMAKTKKMEMPEGGGVQMKMDLFKYVGAAINQLRHDLDENADSVAKDLNNVLFSANKKNQIAMELAALIESAYVNVEMELRKTPRHQVDIEEFISITKDMAPALMENLRLQMAGANDYKRKMLTHLIKGIENLDRFVDTIRSYSKPEADRELAERLRAIKQAWTTAKTETGFEDLNVQQFVDTLQDSIKEMKISSSLAVRAEELFSEEGQESAPAEDQVSSVSERIAGEIWPQLETTYNKYAAGYELALQKFEEALDSIMGMESAETPEEEPEVAPDFSMAEPAFSFAADDGKMSRTADSEVVAPMSPNDMYSNFDLSENRLELREEGGRKKLYVNKDLKNLITKRMNEFTKGAFKEGEMVLLDLDDRIVRATVTGYNGGDIYGVRYEDGRQVMAHKSKLFKL